MQYIESIYPAATAAAPLLLLSHVWKLETVKT